MEEKQQKSKNYGSYYYFWSQDMTLLNSEKERLNRKSERIYNCLNLWEWDKYTNNKVLDLQRVNRCMNNRFCPNCKKMDVTKSIIHFSPIFENLIKEGYKPYLITLTVPNCKGEDLSSTIDKMNKSFRKFNHLYSLSLLDKKSYGNRSIEFNGCLKVLEITYNNQTKMYHPHFHILAFSYDKYKEELFNKNIKGLWSNKKNQQIYNSKLDIEIAKLWTMCFRTIRLTEKNFDNLSCRMGKNENEIFICDIREMDEFGIYEVLKYTFKDSDISNLRVFKTLNIALNRKRIRQGYGILYNIQLEDLEIGEVQDLELKTEEIPEHMTTRDINTLYIEYKDFKKISRFNKSNYKEVLEKVQEFNV
nr:protein rep [Clostridium gasigenes]